MKRQITSWALVAVVATSAFMMVMQVWRTQILSGRNWCAQMLGAGNVAERQHAEVVETIADDLEKPIDMPIHAATDTLIGCKGLLETQLEAMAWDSHIGSATFGLSLLVLVVIVLAGGRLSFKASKDGVEGDMGRDNGGDK